VSYVLFWYKTILRHLIQVTHTRANLPIITRKK
jgi:hypothetical protein